MTIEPKSYQPLHAAINAKLTEIAAASPTPPPWCEAWTLLGPKSKSAEL